MVEFLARKKREGRIGAVYCSTHGTPDYIADLITSGCFDAVMLAYNPLGFHVLSGYAASEGKLQEDLPANRERLFRLASAHGVSVLVMKPLAGGLLGKSKAFPPRHVLAPEREEITAQEVLRYILQQEGVTAVVPGVGNVEEAEEDGLAGHAPVSLPPERARMLEERIAAMRRTLCSRCGKCEPTCSKGLPISWLFRDATIWMNPADSFDTVPRLHYFHLYPEPTLACVLCEEQTCICPQGLDIPRELARVHDGMLDLRAEGLLPRAPRDLECVVGVDDLAARVVYAEVPRMLSAGAAVTCRLWVDNIGRWVWAREEPQAGRVVLNVICDDRVVDRVPLREDAHPGTRAYFAFELRAPRRPGDHSLRLALSCEGRGPDVNIESRTICVVRASNSVVSSRTARARALCQRRRGPRGFTMRSFWKRRRKDAAVYSQAAGTSSVTVIESGSPPVSSTDGRQTHDVRHVAYHLPKCVPPGHVFAVHLTIENTGTVTWMAWSPAGDHVGLAVFWDGKVIANHVLPRPEVRTDEQVTLHFAVEAPLESGWHRLELKMVQYHVTVFEDCGVPPLVADILVEDAPVEPNARLWALSQRVGPWHYLPTRGICRSPDGVSFPVFAKRAWGCHVWDLSGRQYVDYTMGYGTVLLGYAHPNVSAAIAEMLSTGPVVSLPQPIEVELAQMLTEDFPSAEMVCFGKNGSDACTFAVRMARVFTGRRTILYSGYHGWQDFWVEQVGFERTGVPPRDPPLIHRFPFHDLETFRRLYAEHRGDLAAVMVEPSPWAGNGLGFEPDTDAMFLRMIADATREAKALFILDEIVTGYRYPGHSVQKAKGVIPDLTCLGKAIASGMPLSAVVGRADVFKESLPRTFYAATFHSEVYSFAAARASIEVYRNEPVAAHVWDYGLRMQNGIHELCHQLGVQAEAKGPPFRMSFIFTRPDHVIRGTRAHALPAGAAQGGRPHDQRRHAAVLRARRRDPGDDSRRVREGSRRRGPDRAEGKLGPDAGNPAPD